MIRYSLGILTHYLPFGTVLAALACGAGAAALFRRFAPAEHASRRRVRLLGILVSYLLLAFTILIFGRRIKTGNLMNLRLFWSYREIVRGNRTLLYLDVLNVLLFVPFGFLWQAQDRKPAFWRTLCFGGVLSLLAELLQLLFHRGLFELDDLVHNILGTALGAGLFYLARLLWRCYGARLRVKFGVNRDKEQQRGNTMEMTLEEVQRINTDMLGEICRICDKEQIPWWMFYGSLIGAVRHHGMIPWDSDVDIAVPEEYYQRFSEAMERELDPRFWWDYRSDRSYPRCFGRVGLVGYDTYYLHIDVYRLIGYTNKVWINRLLSGYGHLLIRMRLVKTVNPLVYKGRKRSVTKLLKVLLAPLPVRSLVRSFDRLCRRHPCAGANQVGTVDGVKWLIEKRWLDETVMCEYEDIRVPIPKDYDPILTRWYGDYMTPPPGADKPGCCQRKVQIREW